MKKEMNSLSKTKEKDLKHFDNVMTLLHMHTYWNLSKITRSNYKEAIPQIFFSEILRYRVLCDEDFTKYIDVFKDLFSDERDVMANNDITNLKILFTQERRSTEHLLHSLLFLMIRDNDFKELFVDDIPILDHLEYDRENTEDFIEFNNMIDHILNELADYDEELDIDTMYNIINDEAEYYLYNLYDEG